jgi:hypothetical protein
MEDDIQFVIDSFLIERTFQILAEAEQSEDPLRKYAYDLGSLLETLKGGIQSFVQQNVDTSSPSNTARTVLNLLAPAVFFRLHPVLGVLMTVSQLFGLDLVSIYQRIVNTISPLIQSGQPVSAAQVNEAARSALPALSDTVEGDIPATANLMDPLYDIYKNGEIKTLLQKEAVSGTNSQSPLVRMFSFLGPRRGGSLLVGILSWFIKTILMSAGMLAVGGVAASILGLKPTGTTGNAEQVQQTGFYGAPGIKMPAPTNAGSINNRPNPDDLWVENLNGEQPYQRVVDWVIQSYPDLNQYQHIIVRTPSFWNVVSTLTDEWRPGQYQWVIPNPYKTKNEILALFIPDVYRTIQQQQ